jgi:hypothetical protein
MRLHLLNNIKKLVLISGLSGISYFAGRQSIESRLEAVSRPNIISHFNKLMIFIPQCQRENINLLSKPGLPVFSTVSAAALIPRNESFDKPAVIPTEHRIAQIMRYGFPGLDNIRSFDDFVLSYDRKTRTASWVFEHLTADGVKHNSAVDRAKCDFKADDSVHVSESVSEMVHALLILSSFESSSRSLEPITRTTKNQATTEVISLRQETIRRTNGTAIKHFI